jgi:hypothetical protein
MEVVMNISNMSSSAMGGLLQMSANRVVGNTKPAMSAAQNKVHPIQKAPSAPQSSEELNESSSEKAREAGKTNATAQKQGGSVNIFA